MIFEPLREPSKKEKKLMTMIEFNRWMAERALDVYPDFLLKGRYKKKKGA